MRTRTTIGAVIAFTILKRLVVIASLLIVADLCYRPYWNLRDYLAPQKYRDMVTISHVRSPIMSAPSTDLRYWGDTERPWLHGKPPPPQHFYEIDLRSTALCAVSVLLTGAAAYLLLATAETVRRRLQESD